LDRLITAFEGEMPKISQRGARPTGTPDDVRDQDPVGIGSPAQSASELYCAAKQTVARLDRMSGMHSDRDADLLRSVLDCTPPAHAGWRRRRRQFCLIAAWGKERAQGVQEESL
jgi:hypothetical protein